MFKLRLLVERLTQTVGEEHAQVAYLVEGELSQVGSFITLDLTKRDSTVSDAICAVGNSFIVEVSRGLPGQTAGSSSGHPSALIVVLLVSLLQLSKSQNYFPFLFSALQPGVTLLPLTLPVSRVIGFFPVYFLISSSRRWATLSGQSILCSL